MEEGKVADKVGVAEKGDKEEKVKKCAKGLIDACIDLAKAEVDKAALEVNASAETPEEQEAAEEEEETAETEGEEEEDTEG